MNKKIEKVLWPALLGIVILILLQTQILHRVLGFTTLQLPLPSQVLQALADSTSRIFEDILVTMGPAICGMAIGSAIGYAVALFVTIYPGWGFGSMIIMTIINSVPIVALAPLMNRWFETDFLAKVVVIIVAASGAMAVNAYQGLNSPDKELLEMMRISNASRRDVVTKVLIPKSLPNVFTSLKIVIPVAMLAAIISEFFASETSGLGYMIKYSLRVGNQKHVGWAYILAVSVISILIYLIVCRIEKRKLKWHVSQKLN